MVKSKLLIAKNIRNESHKPSLSPPKSVVSRMKKAMPDKIITFLSNFT